MKERGSSRRQTGGRARNSRVGEIGRSKSGKLIPKKSGRQQKVDERLGKEAVVDPSPAEQTGQIPTRDRYVVDNTSQEPLEKHCELVIHLKVKADDLSELAVSSKLPSEQITEQRKNEPPRRSYLIEVIGGILGVALVIYLTILQDNLKAYREKVVLNQARQVSLTQVSEELRENSRRLQFRLELKDIEFLDGTGYRLSRESLGRLKAEFDLRRPRATSWKRAIQVPELLKDFTPLIDSLESFYFGLDNVCKSMDDLLRLWDENVLPTEQPDNLQGERCIGISHVLASGVLEVAAYMETLQQISSSCQGSLIKTIDQCERQKIPDYGVMLPWYSPI
jgi:hypothetical protein